LTPQSIANLNLWVNGRFYKLTDIAKVRPGYSDPPTKMFRVNGRPAIGIGVNMASGGNNLTFGEGLHEVAQRLMQRLPVGIELDLVSDQPQVVKEAIAGFTKALFEAIAIVLVVSFLSLGLRAGVVVALSIPLVLAIAFVGMKAMDISLQRISLGALIIALGLLVDDAMITTEMMISKIEEGMEKMKAATFAYTSTAFPMLTGTLITVFGFLPIGFADNNTGQYTFSLFAVIAVALVASWFVPVIFAPVIGLASPPRSRISRLELGPPVGWPVQYRVSAPTTDEARHYADQVANALRASGLVRNVNYDWAEKSKELRIVVDQDRVRQAGLSSEQLAQALNRVITGTTVTQVRDSIYLIEVVARAESGERSSIEALRSLQITTPTGASVPLRELARFQYELDDGYVWRRGRLSTITVQAEPLPGLEPASVNQRIGGALEAVRASMPAGTLVQVGV
jgi:multidrug efflux pump subunit AcrB